MPTVTYLYSFTSYKVLSVSVNDTRPKVLTIATVKIHEPDSEAQGKTYIYSWTLDGMRRSEWEEGTDSAHAGVNSW